MQLPAIEKKLLLVDDEADIREVLTLALCDLGYTVTTANSGVTALTHLREMRPPMVITDIKMPGMDGIELLRRVKASYPDTEVIMITGHGDLDLAVMSLKNQATDFITKPINVDALEIALRRAEERIIMRRQLSAYTERLERLVQEKAELRDHLSSLGMMIGSISHAIKGLLTSLDGGLYLVESALADKESALADKGSAMAANTSARDDAAAEMTGPSNTGRPTIHEGWRIVKRAVESIRKLMLDILFYAKKREFTFETVTVAAFAQELVQAMRAKLAAGGVEFRADIAADLGSFAIDRSYLRAALANILENAFDACGEGQNDAARIEIAVSADTDRVCFKVSDTGAGMDSETLDKLFTVFFSTKGRSGTGLGLFVANQVVSQHGGEIHVRSTPGRGTTFRVLVPRSPALDR